jgi:hypothetical protein
MMRKLYFFAFMALFSYVSVSQNVQIERHFFWSEYVEKEGVLFEYKFEECNIPSEGFFREYVLVRLTNSNNYDVVVDWDIVKWYGLSCVNCDYSNKEQHRSVSLKAGFVLEGSCALDEFPKMKMFSKFLNFDAPDSELTNFQLENIEVKPLK